MSKHDDESCCGVRIWIYLLSGIFAIAFVFLIGISVVGILNASCTYTYSQGNSYAYNCQNNQLVYYPAIVVLLFFLLVLIWLFISTCTRSRIGYMVFIVVACIFLLMEISGILTFLIFWIISLFHQFSSFNDFTSAIGQTYLSIIITILNSDSESGFKMRIQNPDSESRIRIQNPESEFRI
uniref:Uncharacterized protein n=1 Tax=Acrobeloides nanus TaxID=290746 RepID=A0A914CWB9_9BILA